MSICASRACETQQSPEESVRSLGTMHTSNVSQCVNAENQTQVPKQQPMLLTTEPSLQPFLFWHLCLSWSLLSGLVSPDFFLPSRLGSGAVPSRKYCLTDEPLSHQGVQNPGSHVNLAISLLPSSKARAAVCHLHSARGPRRPGWWLALMVWASGTW